MVNPFVIQPESIEKIDELESKEDNGSANIGFSERHWDVINDGMVAVVHSSEGTARGIGYTSKTKIAGKTGTSQVFSIGQDEELEEEDIPDHLKDHALFVAYAPPKNPEIAIAVLVEHGGSGSSTAAPIARKLLDYYFKRDIDENNLVYRLHIDTPLLAGIIIMCLVGLVVLYSASEQSIDLVIKQGLRMLVGLIAMLFVAQIPPHRLAHWAPILYLGALLLLGLVLLFGTGRGVQRWLDAGLFKFQPSELMKVIVPLMVASLVSKKLLPPDLKTILIALIVTAIPTFLIGRQPDLGTAIVVAASGLVVLFFSGISWKFIRNGLLIGVAIAPIGWFAMHEYQRQRDPYSV